jgi:catechol 2,3-dioxygenase
LCLQLDDADKDTPAFEGGRRLWGIFFNGPERLDTTSNGSMSEKVIDAGVRVGHVHLKVSDLERALGFYRDVLGFEVTQRMGDSAAFLSAGGYHHHIGLNTWDSAGGSAPAAGTTGLYHLAIVYPTRAKLGDALRRLIEAHIPLDGAADHGVSEALYLRDPDGNGVELYWDRPQKDWPRNTTGELAMYTRTLDLQRLLDAAD